MKIKLFKLPSSQDFINFHNVGNVPARKYSIHLFAFSVIEEFLVLKNEMFSKVKEMLDADEDDEDGMAKLSVKIQHINEKFQELCLKTWHTLMQKELYLFEAMEVGAIYKSAKF